MHSKGIYTSGGPYSGGPYNTDPNKGGIKADAGKIRVELLPFGAINAVAEVMTWATVGKKGPDGNPYPDDNWRKGMSWRRITGSLLRHTFAWMRGEDRDPESGLHHMAHAGACVLFLLEYIVDGSYAEHDDRYRR